jgi:hypothetical protein
MFTALILGLASAGMVKAHMQLYSPAPFRAFNNPHTIGDPDIYIDFPHNCCGKITPMPCRGYLDLLGTPEGAAVASWPAGSRQIWSIVGPSKSSQVRHGQRLMVTAPYGGNHYGGSCQIGFSIDKGQTFRATTTYEGDCPHRTGGMNETGQQFPFTVPGDVPLGEQIFAWTWMNREREFFMNCAVVNITASPYTNAKRYLAEEGGVENAKRWYQPLLDVTMKYKRVPGEKAQRYVKRLSATPFTQRPTMLFADVNNGWLSPLTTAELKYPNPGPDVVEGDGEYPLQLPTGNCTS